MKKMSKWIRGPNAARQISRSLDPCTDYEPGACYQSFIRHWEQAYHVINNSQPQNRKFQDDVLTVVNHLEQIASLLLLESRARELNVTAAIYSDPAACLGYLLSENLLDKLYEWTLTTGRYQNAVHAEQLKIYYLLTSNYGAQVLAAEPFLRPLLKLLSGFRNQLPLHNVTKQLILVLNALCVVLVQNVKFIDLFFLTDHLDNGTHSEWVVGGLLMGAAHAEGVTGAAARDALLLCAQMSVGSASLRQYLERSGFAPILATGLSGLYSLLPRALPADVVRLTPDDINAVPKLALFVDSLEFCNKVAQVAHSSIRKQLLDFLKQGFLVPVMGPALLQMRGADGSQSGAAEQAAAGAYVEVCLRCVSAAATGGGAGTEGLLPTFLAFLTTHEYDGVRLLDVLLARLDGEYTVSLVSLSLMETLVELSCEDVMFELVLKYLVRYPPALPTSPPGTHSSHPTSLPSSHSTFSISSPNVPSSPPNLNGSPLNLHGSPPDSHPGHQYAHAYREASQAYLALSPNCCARPFNKTREWAENVTVNGRRVLEKRNETRVQDDHSIAMDNLTPEVNVTYGNPDESLLGNYHAYLCDARVALVSRAMACAKWSKSYDNPNELAKKENNNTSVVNSEAKLDNYEAFKVQNKNRLSEQDSVTSNVAFSELRNENKTEYLKEMEIQQHSTKEQDSIISIATSGYETLKSGDCSKDPDSLTSLDVRDHALGGVETHNSDTSGKEQDSLTSLGESSEYDSFRYRVEDIDDSMDGYAEDSFMKKYCCDIRSNGPVDILMRDDLVGSKCNLGPLLNSLMKKVTRFLQSDLEQIFRVTSLISKLATYPMPVLSSLILCPQETMPSLYLVLSRLKREVDELTRGVEGRGEGAGARVDEARAFLVRRELARANTRRHATPHEMATQDSAGSGPQRREEVVFRRQEPKRKSFSSSLNSMFRRRLSSGGSSQSPTYSAVMTHVATGAASNFTQEAYWAQSPQHRAVLNAVIMDEWLKELSAIACEHALRFGGGGWEDDHFEKAVCL